MDIIRDTFDLNFKHPEIKKRNYKTKFKSHERINQLLHLIKMNKSIKARDLANQLNISVALISMYAKDLENTGKVIRKKVGINIFYELVL